jgi:hypothetical protein
VNAIATAATAAMSLVMSLLLCGLAGGFVLSLFDSGAGWGAWAAYAIWLLVGVVAGLFAFDSAGGLALRAGPGIPQSWIERAGARRVGTIILATDAVLIGSAMLLVSLGPVETFQRRVIACLLATLGTLAFARTVGMAASGSADRTAGLA